MATRPSAMKMISAAMLALLACYLAYRSWDDAHYAFLRGSNSATAHAARPYDAISLGRQIDKRLEREPGSRISDSEASGVRAALSEAPLSRVLLRILGLKAEQDSDIVLADRFLRLSNAVSRRDALAQLALIERSVSKQDMNAAVRHYHAALSVHPELGPALYPILAKAIDYPEVRAALSPYIAGQTRWSADMLNIAIAHGNPVSVAELIIPIGDMAQGETYGPINANLISQLSNAGDFALAGKLAIAVIPRFSQSSLTSLAVNDATADRRLGSLAWRLAEEGRILASINGLGGFDVDIEPLTRGTVAARTISIVGGRKYMFRQTLRGGSVSDSAATLNWEATCVPSRSVIWQQTLPKPRRTQRYESIISVPTDCSGINLVLTARGPEGQQASHLAFEAFELTPRVN